MTKVGHTYVAIANGNRRRPLPFSLHDTPRRGQSALGQSAPDRGMLKGGATSLFTSTRPSAGLSGPRGQYTLSSPLGSKACLMPKPRWSRYFSVTVSSRPTAPAACPKTAHQIYRGEPRNQPFRRKGAPPRPSCFSPDSRQIWRSIEECDMDHWKWEASGQPQCPDDIGLRRRLKTKSRMKPALKRPCAATHFAPPSRARVRPSKSPRVGVRG